jgi:hypothetical protein
MDDGSARTNDESLYDDRVRPDAEPIVDADFSEKCCDSSGGAVVYDAFGEDGATFDPTGR